jgi:hypothetical protein
LRLKEIGLYKISPCKAAVLKAGARQSAPIQIGIVVIHAVQFDSAEVWINVAVALPPLIPNGHTLLQKSLDASRSPSALQPSILRQTAFT